MKNEFYTVRAEVLSEGGWKKIINYLPGGNLRYGNLEEIEERTFKTLEDLYEYIRSRTMFTSFKVLTEGKIFHKREIGFIIRGDREDSTEKDDITVMENENGYRVRYIRERYQYVPTFKNCMESLPEDEFVQYLKDRAIKNVGEIIKLGLDK